MHDEFLISVPLDDPAYGMVIDTLNSEGQNARTDVDEAQLAEMVRAGDGLLITTFDVIRQGDTNAWIELLSAQPVWSMLPVLLIGSDRPHTAQDHFEVADKFTSRCCVFRLDRPVTAKRISNACRAAIEAKTRQRRCQNLLQEHDHVEQALRESEERLAMALEAGRMGAWQWDLANNRVIWSRSLEEIYGYGPGEFQGTYEAFEEAIHENDREQVNRSIERAVREATSELHLEYRIRRPDGTLVWLESRGKLFRSESGAPLRMRGVCADITQRKQFEQQLKFHHDHLAELVNNRTQELEESHQRLRHTERLAAMGTLAAGLGHDMGNLVFPLRIRLDLMRSRQLSHAMRSDLESIHNAVEHLQRLANGLRHMAMDAGESGIGPESTDIDDWWLDVEPVLRNALARNVVLEPNIQHALPHPTVASHSLTQAIFNLVQNANEVLANQSSGKITVSISRGEDDHSVVIEVTDNGPGMTQAVRDRCLEPFFTTKVRGISTGLGLSLVHGVVNRAGGRIELLSDVGFGTTWKLTLPAVQVTQSNGYHRRSGTARTALVEVNDARIAAFVTALLNTMGLDTVYENETNITNPNWTIWVSEADQLDMDSALDFLNERSSRRLILLGHSDQGLGNHPQVIVIEEPLTSAAIRQGLRQLLDHRRLATHG